MKVNILVECPQFIASVKVGVMNLLQPLEELGMCRVKFLETKLIMAKDLCWCDILICVRGCEYPTYRIVKEAKRLGRFLIYFLDDDLLDIPQGNESTAYYSEYYIKLNIIEIIKYCDILMSVNQKILEKYSQWCNRTVLSRVPAKVISPPPKTKKKDIVHVVYAGSVDHNTLVQDQLSPAVKSLLNDYVGKIDFTFIGADPKLEDIQGVKHIPFFESYDQYQKEMLNGNFSIGLAPSYNTSFYTYKYYNKYIEYSSYGIAGIYANCGPYPAIVHDNFNGLLCDGTPQGWYNTILRLAQDSGLRFKLASRSKEILESQFDIKSIVEQIEESIPELTQYHAPKANIRDVKLPCMRFLFYIERIRIEWKIHKIRILYIIPYKAINKFRKIILKKLRE